MGYEFEIHYKEGRDNVTADALSRIDGGELMSLVLNSIEPDLLQQIKSSWSGDMQLQKLTDELKQNPSSHPICSCQDITLRRKGKLVVGNSATVKSFILHWLHDSAIGGHSGRDNTAARVKALFYWKGMTRDIQAYIRDCVVCQRSKPE